MQTSSDECLAYDHELSKRHSDGPIQTDLVGWSARTVAIRGLNTPKRGCRAMADVSSNRGASF